MRRTLKRRQREHHVGRDRAYAPTQGLSNGVEHRIARADRAEQSVDERDGRVEVRAGHRTEHEDESNQRPGCRDRVLEELKADIVW